jgi:Na+-translocating ferredoxin:NAD+ oxidoreductase RnfC subunit
MELQAFKDLLRASGVVGAGGAGFPTYAKLSDKVDTVILNCAECEPLLKLHRGVLEEYTGEVLSALSEILRATGAKRGIVAIKKHYRSTLAAVEAEIGDYPNLSVHTLPSVYPMGDEIILIKEVTGRTVQPGNLPVSVGVTVCNVETVYNVYRALHGQPVTHKFVTVAGEVKKPLTLRVPIGTGLAELVKAAGGATVDEPAYLVGGPMMGRLASARDTVTKTTNALILLPPDHTVVLNKQRNAKIALRRAMSVCCQCRTCTELCSRHTAGYPVTPHMVMRVLSNGGKGDLASLGGSLYCSGCGLCEEYACPQDLSPKALIAEMKAERRRLGQKPRDDFEPAPISPDAAWKKVSVSRLTERLGLAAYDGEAPLQEQFETKTVKLLLSQHIGAPATPTVAVGDRVRCGQTVAKAAEGALSVDLHASLDGVVTAVTSKYIKLKTE